MTRLKNLGRIEYGGGFLSLFVVVGGAAVQKDKHLSFPLWCVISCDKVILTHLIINIGEGEYPISSN